MNNKTLIAASFICLTILGSTCLYLAQLTKIENTKNLLVSQERKRQESLRETCLDRAHSNYIFQWKLSVDAYGSKTKNTLPRFLSQPIDDDYAQEQELCIKKYPVK